MNKIHMLGILFLLTFAAQAQTADEIIEKHLEAIGGKAWEAVKTMRMESKQTVRADPGLESPLTITVVTNSTITVVTNRAARVDVLYNGMTQSTCINGEKSWANNTFTGSMDAEPLTADQVEELKGMTDLTGSLYNYKAKGYLVEYVGKEDIEGTEALKIKIVKSPYYTEYALIDQENWYQIMNIIVGTDDGKEKEIISMTRYSDFRKVGSLVFPYTFQQTNAIVGHSVTKVTELKLNEPVDEKIFDMPAKK